VENITGRDIGKYHIIERLGTGGMAVVYKAFDTSLERHVAIKFIRKETIGEQYFSLLQQRFEREARVLASLDHPNIVTILEYGQYQGSPYLVMKFIPCGALHPDGRPMPYAQAARLLLPVARALEYAHRRGVIHRDLKPSNILLCENGDPTLSDFGIAKILDAPADGSSDVSITSLTGTGLPIGTPEYMAPEQWQGKPCAQSDIYGLGVVLYELITGRRPYTADTPAAVMIKQVTEPLPRPRDFVRGLPEEVESILFKALALKPENRYAVMGDFCRALEQVARHEPPAEAYQAVTPAPAPAVPQPAPAPVLKPAPALAAPVEKAPAPAAAAPLDVPVPVKVIPTDYGAAPRVPVTVTDVAAPPAAPGLAPALAPVVVKAAPQTAVGPAVPASRPVAPRAKPARRSLLLWIGGAGFGLVIVLLLIGWAVSSVLGSARTARTATPAPSATGALSATPALAATADLGAGAPATSVTETATAAASPTPWPTQTIAATSTAAASTATDTAVPSSTFTSVPVSQPTATPRPAASSTPKPAATNTPKPAPTNTPKPAPTNTPLPPAPTATSASRPATPTPP
jgi:serine/threonine-protein kinase